MFFGFSSFSIKMLPQPWTPVGLVPSPKPACSMLLLKPPKSPSGEVQFSLTSHSAEVLVEVPEGGPRDQVELPLGGFGFGGR